MNVDEMSVESFNRKEAAAYNRDISIGKYAEEWFLK